jgi:hypothetical protein
MRSNHQIPADAKLVLGIVDDLPFRKEQKLNDALVEKLGVFHYPSYNLRFQESLNPSDIGVIIKSIWESSPYNSASELPEWKEEKRYIIMANAALVAMCLYDPPNKLDEEKIRVVTRTLPIEEEKKQKKSQIGWYFPIFDLNDIDDIGIIANFLYNYLRATPEMDPDLENSYIYFARFNYHLPENQGYILNNTLGAYAKLIEKELKSEPKLGYDALRGLEYPSRDTIPFIFRWSHLVYIYAKIFNFLQRIEKGIEDNSQKDLVQDLKNRCKRNIDYVKMPERPFSQDLSDFNAFLNYLGNLFKKNKNTLGPYQAKLNNLVQTINEATYMIRERINKSSCKNWLETHRDAETVFQDIRSKLEEL